MFDDKEIEELYSEFLSLDGKMFLESDENVSNLEGDFITNDVNINFLKSFSNSRNNNFILNTSVVNLEKPGASTKLDLLNKNFFVLEDSESDKNSENTKNGPDSEAAGGITDRAGLFSHKKGNEMDDEFKEIDEKLISPDLPMENNSLNQNGWSPDIPGLWHSGPSSLNLGQIPNNYAPLQDLTLSVVSNSHEPQSMSSFLPSSKRTYSHLQLGAKVEMVYSLLSMLDMDNREDMSKTFLAMSSSAESCQAMRQSGCLPLLIQLIHSHELNKEVRKRAAEALHNVVHAQTDEKRRRREVRVLKLLEQMREYCEELRNDYAQDMSQFQDSEKHPINAIGTLMKFSFDAEHRQAICVLGGLHAVTQLLQVDHEAHGTTNDDSNCITLRRYAGMSLTNLTFGDGKNKALLCSFNKFMRALVDQLKSPSEDLRQVTASVLRNLSWRADSESKQALRNVGAVTALTVSAMEGKKESTLKSILSALWNLSAHCSVNKIDICSVPGALAFLVKMLRYKSASNTLSIVENAGGILRNVSSHIAVREDYRQILRDNNCFEILLEQLKSPSLTVVSNACGTLWNLSARCSEDQKRLWEMGATTMLRSLVQSKHKMISMGSSAALKNLLTANPDENLLNHLDSTAKSLGLQNLPTLFVRKKKALEQELNITLAETCDNIDPVGSPTHCDPNEGKIPPKRSESRDSVQSSQSDSVSERVNQITLTNEEKVFENKIFTLHNSLDEKSIPRKVEEQKLVRRYKSSMIPMPKLKKINQGSNYEDTKEEAAAKDTANEMGNNTFLNTNYSIEKNKKGISMLETKIKNKVAQFYEASGENISSRSNEMNLGEKCDQTANSLTHEESIDSKKPHSSRLQVIEINECKNEEKNEKMYQENSMHLKEDLPQVFPSTPLSEKNVSSDNPKLFEKISAVCSNKIKDGFQEDINKKCIIQHGFYEKKIFSNNRLNRSFDPYQITRSVTPDKHSKIGGSGGDKETSLEESVSDLVIETTPKKEKLTSNKNFFSDVESLISRNRLKDKYPSHVSSSEFLNVSQCCYLEPSKLLDDDGRDQEIVDGMISEQIDAKKPNSTFLLSGSANEDLDTSKIPKSFFKAEKSKIMFLNGSPEDLNESFIGTMCESNNKHQMSADTGDDILPKFKVGSPITDSSVLQTEANKICCELKKQQDLDMGCSLTSEVSLVSCSSFLDMGDYSLFDSLTDANDFEDSENSLLGKTYFKIKSFPSWKSKIFHTADSVSLPSLGSLKNDQLDALDLDNSVLSVASITSETAETNSKDFEAFTTFTETYKNKVDSENEIMEDTFADITFISNEDDTLNADSSFQNGDFVEEDNSLHSQENLPFDSGNLQLEQTSDLKNKKLTPKEKRKTFQERYRTYTIRYFQDSNPSVKDFDAKVQGSNTKVALDLARQNNQLACDHANLSMCTFNHKSEEEQLKRNSKKEKDDLPLSIYQKGSRYEKWNFSKSLDKERYGSPDFVSDSRSLTNLLSIGPAERKELVDNAKLVAFSLKTAIQESENISDSEAEDDHKSIEIDTATYNKSNRDRSLGKYDSQGFRKVKQHEEDSAEEDPEKKGARILKPNDGAEKKLEHSKGIRGRRKPLYSSPRKFRATEFSSSTPKTSREVLSKKTLTEAFSSPVLHREGTFTKKDVSDLKKVEPKTSQTTPLLHKNTELKGLNFTSPFNKNKPVSSTANSKRAEENQVSKIGRPLSTYTSKYIERRAEFDSILRRPFSAGAGNKIGGTKTGTSSKTILSSLAYPKMRTSSSNQNIKAGNSSVKSRNLTLQNSKSQSDASLNFVASKDKESYNRNLPCTGSAKQKLISDTLETEQIPKKKEVTSKIASLWRKVEETKQRNQNLKDNRVWICSEKNAKTLNEVLVVEKEEILDIPTRKILHSVTCQTLADEISA